VLFDSAMFYKTQVGVLGEPSQGCG